MSRFYILKYDNIRIMILLLDNIRSIQNVATIFRTADAVGIEKIYLCGITPSPLDEFGRKRQQFTKISLGAEDSVAWEKCKQSYLVLNSLKISGYKIFAIEQHKKSIPYFKAVMPKNKKIVFILGHELKGISGRVLKRVDKILEIPMFGKKQSLNVAIAAAIVIFYFAIQNNDT